MTQKNNPKRSKSTLERRRFILEQANWYGQVSFDKIKEGGYSAGWQSLKGDDELFASLNLGVRLKKKEAKFVLTSRDILSTYAIRQQEDQEEKKAIGELAGALLWGTRSTARGGASHARPSKEMVVDQLSRNVVDGNMPSRARESAERLLRRLDFYWRKQNRYCALDAGTTTVAVAKCLVGKRAPDGAAGIASLTVLTNAPRIEEILQEPSTSTDVVALGGLLRKATMAHTGLLCEQCLGAWQIRLDITMVGTTSLTTTQNSEGLCFTCDSPEEARTKGLLLEKADIRCVLMSSSKCARYRSSAFVFASVSSEFVDFVITDEGILERKNRELWDSLCNAGINVLAAKTHD